MDSKSNYRPPTLTVDLVAFRIHDHRLEVLLLKRGHEPFKGEWALPGGYNSAGETTVEALARIVETKIGFDISEKLGYFEQLYTVDTVARDPRGHAVSVVYMGCGHDFDIADGTEQHRFWPVDDLPDIAFDHKEIIVNARERLASKLSYSNAVMGLLAEKFTLTHVQVAYEAVLNRKVDKRNFRKKFLSLGLIEETDELWTEGAHRPARLYRFSSRNYEILPSQF